MYMWSSKSLSIFIDILELTLARYSFSVYRTFFHYNVSSSAVDGGWGGGGETELASTSQFQQQSVLTKWEWSSQCWPSPSYTQPRQSPCTCTAILYCANKVRNGPALPTKAILQPANGWLSLLDVTLFSFFCMQIESISYWCTWPGNR